MLLGWIDWTSCLEIIWHHEGHQPLLRSMTPRIQRDILFGVGYCVSRPRQPRNEASGVGGTCRWQYFNWKTVYQRLSIHGCIPPVGLPLQDEPTLGLLCAGNMKMYPKFMKTLGKVQTIRSMTLWEEFSVENNKSRSAPTCLRDLISLRSNESQIPKGKSIHLRHVYLKESFPFSFLGSCWNEQHQCWIAGYELRVGFKVLLLPTQGDSCFHTLGMPHLSNAKPLPMCGWAFNKASCNKNNLVDAKQSMHSHDNIYQI